MEIAIYAEGGGDTADQKADLRQGFDGLFKRIKAHSRRLPKGKYGKVKHASKLLQLVDPEKVAARCPRFGMLTRWLEQVVGAG